MYRETTFIRSSTARKETTTEKIDRSETLSRSERAAAQEVEFQQGQATKPSPEKARAAASTHQTVQDDWGNIEEVDADALASAGSPTPSEERTLVGQQRTDIEQANRSENDDPSLSYVNVLAGDKNPTPTSFRLLSPESVDKAFAEICAQCADRDCNLRCQTHQELLNHLQETAVQSGDARLHVIPVDPLSWFRKTEGDTKRYRALLAKTAKSVKSAYAYRTFKGSDHVFVCLSDDGCLEFGDDLSETLTDGLGSRAIFAVKGAHNSSLQWPCPLRVIDLDREDVDDVTSDADRIVRKASFMIEKRNRWICADKDHPAAHWERMMKVEANGVVMKQ